MLHGKETQTFFFFFHLEKDKYMLSHVYSVLDKEEISRNLTIVIQAAARKLSSLGLA